MYLSCRLFRWFHNQRSVCELRKHSEEPEAELELEGHLPGIHGQAGYLPLATGPGVRNEAGRRSFARKGRSSAFEPAGVQLGEGGQGGHRCRCDRHLRSATRRGQCHNGSHRGGDSAGRVHYRGCSPARHGQGQARPAGSGQVPAGWPQLPWNYCSRTSEL